MELLLLIPTIWELFDDRKGDAHTNYHDIAIRSVLCFICGWVVAGIDAARHFEGIWNTRFLNHLLAAIILSAAIFFLLFDYIYNRLFIKYHNWYTYKGAHDTSWFYNFSPGSRLFYRIMFFILTLLWYILSQPHLLK